MYHSMQQSAPATPTELAQRVCRIVASAPIDKRALALALADAFIGGLTTQDQLTPTPTSIAGGQGA